MSSCSEDPDTDAVLPSQGDCYETWRGDGQTWVTLPMRKGVDPVSSPGVVGRPIVVREGDCPEGLRPGGRSLTLRQVAGVDPTQALVAPGEEGYERRVFVPLAYRSGTDRPVPPAPIRDLLRRYADAK